MVMIIVRWCFLTADVFFDDLRPEDRLCRPLHGKLLHRCQLIFQPENMVFVFESSPLSDSICLSVQAYFHLSERVRIKPVAYTVFHHHHFSNHHNHHYGHHHGHHHGHQHGHHHDHHHYLSERIWVKPATKSAPQIG